MIDIKCKLTINERSMAIDIKPQINIRYSTDRYTYSATSIINEARPLHWLLALLVHQKENHFNPWNLFWQWLLKVLDIIKVPQDKTYFSVLSVSFKLIHLLWVQLNRTEIFFDNLPPYNTFHCLVYLINIWVEFEAVMML